MAKDPAFLFYPGDFTTGTQFFTDEQIGKYIRLLMAQHQLGHLEEKHMIMICKSYDNDVFSKFDKDSDNKYYNKRLEDEIVKRKNYTESRGNNKRGKKIISISYDNHMEDKNKDIVLSTSINKGVTNFFYIGLERYNTPISVYVKSAHQQILEVWQMQNKDIPIERIFETMDKECIGKNFTDDEHTINAFKWTYKDLKKGLKQFTPEQNKVCSVPKRVEIR